MQGRRRRRRWVDVIYFSMQLVELEALLPY